MRCLIEGWPGTATNKLLGRLGCFCISRSASLLWVLRARQGWFNCEPRLSIKKPHLRAHSCTPLEILRHLDMRSWRGLWLLSFVRHFSFNFDLSGLIVAFAVCFKILALVKGGSDFGTWSWKCLTKSQCFAPAMSTEAGCPYDVFGSWRGAYHGTPSRAGSLTVKKNWTDGWKVFWPTLACRRSWELDGD